MRANCHRCQRPMVRCLCAAIPVIRNRTHILLYQHRREGRHAFGSVPFLRQSLQRLTFHSVDDFGCAMPEDVAGWALLYPTPGAVDLETLPVGQRPRGLVVLDGTWWQAKKMLAASAWMHTIPAVRVNSTQASRYLIRREPNAAARSTLEAVIYALQGLEGDTDGLDALLGVFDRMNHAQLVTRRTLPPQPRRRRLRVRESRTIPWALVDQRQRLVVLHVERLPGTISGGVQRASYAIVAHRSDCATTFHSVGASAADLRVAWAAWAPAEPLVVAWHVRELSILQGLLGVPMDSIALKHVVANLAHARPPEVDRLDEVYGLTPAGPPIEGRLGRRLGTMIALVDALRVRSAVRPDDPVGPPPLQFPDESQRP